MANRFHFVDDCLPNGLFTEAVEWHGTQDMSNSMGPGAGIRNFTDGTAFHGNTLLWMGEDFEDRLLNSLVHQLLKEFSQQPEIVGVYGKDWDCFTLTPWCHPVGARLGWHTDHLKDGPVRKAAFTLFLNPTWEYDWGGHLQIIDRPSDEVDMEARPQWKGRAPSLDNPLPVVIPPKPNRLAFFTSGTWHSVSRIDPSAGDTLRQTVVGFLMNSSGDGE